MYPVPLWAWLVFAAFIASLLWLDVKTQEKQSKSLLNAFLWTGIWIGAALLFNLFVWRVAGEAAAGEYLAAYTVERIMSMEIMFFFVVVFSALAIPREHQGQVIFTGILAAILFQTLFLYLGTEVLSRRGEFAYLLAALLLFLAWRLFHRNPLEQEESRLVNWMSNHLPVKEDTGRDRFIAIENGRKVATPLLIALAAIMITDLFSGVNTMAVIVSMSRDRFLLYTSNIFALLGLRALFLLLAGSMNRLVYLHRGLALVLAFAGTKLLVGGWVQIPPLFSVVLMLLIISGSVLASLFAAESQPVT